MSVECRYVDKCLARIYSGLDKCPVNQTVKVTTLQGSVHPDLTSRHVNVDSCTAHEYSPRLTVSDAEGNETTVASVFIRKPAKTLIS